MNLSDILIILGVALIAGGALYTYRRRVKKGCSCGCGGCSRTGCPARKDDSGPDPE